MSTLEDNQGQAATRKPQEAPRSSPNQPHLDTVKESKTTQDQENGLPTAITLKTTHAAVDSERDQDGNPQSCRGRKQSTRPPRVAQNNGLDSPTEPERSYITPFYIWLEETLAKLKTKKTLAEINTKLATRTLAEDGKDNEQSAGSTIPIMPQWSAKRGILHNLNQRRTKLRAKASAINTVIQDPTIAQQPKVIAHSCFRW